ncbi:MAG: C25 family cysteine peptidase [Bacteroidia bacterium]
MRKYYIIYFLLLMTSRLLAQTYDYGSAWYQENVNRPFIKLVVSETGIYRVAKSDLIAAGHTDIGSKDATKFRLYFRGNEIPLFISPSNASTTFDFIEFFGKKNDGRLDSTMYRRGDNGTHDNDAIPDIELSIFSDSAAYFLTWEGGTGFPARISPNPFSNQYDPNILSDKFFREVKAQLTLAYVNGAGGATSAEHALNCDYTDGEGYQGASFSLTTSYTNNLKTPNAIANPPSPAILKARTFGRSSSAGHDLEIYVNNSLVFDTLIFSQNNSALNVYQKTFTIPITSSISSTTPIKFGTGNTYSVDNNHVSWFSLGYWRGFQFDGEKTVMLKNWKVENGLRYLRFDNIGGSDGSEVLVYSLTGFPTRTVGTVTSVATNRRANVVMPANFTQASDLWMATDSAILKPVIKANHAFSDLRHPADGGAKFVIITHRSLDTSALAYKTYRDTCTVNQLSTKVIYTDQIYEEYSYGSITPLAIQRFCKDALDNWQIKPEYFMIWGKGSYLTKGATNKSLVPAFGYPATDYEFISHYGTNEFKITPEAAIGRVSIYSDAQGLGYLAKINDYEHKSWDKWLKRGVFLGGGEDAPEQTAIKNALDLCRTVFANPPFGGDTVNYQKKVTTTIDPNANYHQSISEGTSLIHFFGHSTSNISDIKLGEPTEYTSIGKYPIMIAMGCYGGDFTSGDFSFGERWMLNKERGALAYIANSTEGFLAPLELYAKELYPKMYVSMLGQRIGDIFKAHTTDYMNLHASSVGAVDPVLNRNNGRQMNLQGDPTMLIKSPQKPDFEIISQDLSYNPEILTSFTDSFGLKFQFRNLGRVNPNDTFAITIRQQFPDGVWYNHPTIKTTCDAYEESITLKLLNPIASAMTGPNNFEIFIDPANEVEEYENYANNKVVANVIVVGNVPAPIFPIKYAVVPNNQISLIASSFSITRDSTVRYIFEIDTVYDFVSPFVKSQEVIGKSNFAEWNLPFTLQDSQVYYWRVRLADAQPSIWAYSTFKYIANKQGWAQAEIPQFSEDKLNNVLLDIPHDKWSFGSIGQNFELRVGYSNSPSTSNDENNVSLFQNGQLVSQTYHSSFGYLLIVIDAKTLKLKYNPWKFYKLGTASNPTANPLALQTDLRDDLLNIQQGDYFFFCSSISARLDLFTSETFDYLEDLGINTLRNRPGDTDFAIFGRKGYPSETIENYTPLTETKKIVLSKILYTPQTNGTISSVRIGPAKKWNDLVWNWKTLDPLVKENTAVDVYGVRLDGTDSLIMTVNTTGTQSLNIVSAKKFPYLYLKATIQDSIYRTAPQLDNWHILYDPAPDAIVDPFQDYSFQNETLIEGQDLFINIGAKNPTSTGMDSLLVAFRITREDGSEIIFPNKRFAPLPANGRIPVSSLTGNTSTLNLSGKCRFTVELNPNFDQVEQYSFNNLYTQNFKIGNDDKNPMLDVTFDGKHILDDDIVSPTPEILCELKDENQFLAMNDTSAFELWFQDANETNATYRRIKLNDPRVEFIPASLPNNKAKLIFKPGELSPLANSGTNVYKLKIRGKDKRDNYSGKDNTYYEVNFKVIRDRTITNVLNYPNPFSTSTRFAYILTGDELPRTFQIHIYTITGKLVKTIDLTAAGDVHFGKNVTEYAWDGTDEFGDKLANGVYLYRVVLETQSDDLKASDLDDKTDKMFKNGWGKMYLMR